MFYFDAHNHLCHSFYPSFPCPVDYSCISSFCTEGEWRAFLFHDRKNILKSFGLHPQMFSDPKMSRADFEGLFFFLRSLLENDSIFAVGEIGFDFFNEEFRRTEKIQTEFFERQIDLAAAFGKPIVVHCRKAMDRIFSFSKSLSSLPAVVFHSFPGGKNDASSLLKKGVNAFFSFGKHQLMNGKRLSVEMLSAHSDFPGRILFETDCPYQTLKGESETSAAEIVRVYEKASEICGSDSEKIALAAFANLLDSCGLESGAILRENS